MEATKYNIKRLQLPSGIYTTIAIWRERCRPPPGSKNKRSNNNVQDTQLLESTTLAAEFTHLWELGCFCFPRAVYRLKVLNCVYKTANPAINSVGCRSPPLQSEFPKNSDWRKGS